MLLWKEKEDYNEEWKRARERDNLLLEPDDLTRCGPHAIKAGFPLELPVLPITAGQTVCVLLIDST